MNNFKKSAIATAVATTMGAPAAADIIDVSLDGWFTVINASGTDALNNIDSTGGPWYGWRTPISGAMNFDTTTGSGSGTIAPFSFFGSGAVSATTISFQAIGDGDGGSGPLLLGNMGFYWSSGSNSIPISIVWDASGFFGAVQGGLTTSDLITGGTLAATQDFNFSNGKSSYTLPLGPAPLATTTWNTTNIGTPALGINPSGTLPLTDDDIGGSPMPAGPFKDFNFNFDFTALHVDSITSTVPIPAAVWLFGSGLLCLVGVARHKKAA